MKITIFDVEHGFCALAESGGYSMMFDCGAGETFAPSKYLLERGVVVDELVISHPHADHLSDFDALARHNLFRAAYWNRHRIPARPVGLLELLAPRTGVEAFQGFRALSPPAPAPSQRFPDGSVVEFFSLRYPFEATTENDLSLVTFIHAPSFSIVFPGDLEATGWRTLLREPSFKRSLGRTDIFVASHHGRDNGYCREVFEICRPKLAIVSDGRRQFDSQDCDYGCDALGWYVDGDFRKTLSTRWDGVISIESSALGPRISTGRSQRSITATFLALLGAGGA